MVKPIDTHDIMERCCAETAITQPILNTALTRYYGGHTDDDDNNNYLLTVNVVIGKSIRDKSFGPEYLAKHSSGIFSSS